MSRKLLISLVLFAASGCPDSDSGVNATLDITGQAGDSTTADTVTDVAVDAGTDAFDDVEPEDTGPVDGGPVSPADCDSDPAGAYCPCAENADCDGSICAETAQGKQCAAPCDGGCRVGWACENVGNPASGAESVRACIDRTRLGCMPCQTNDDCAIDGYETLDECQFVGAGGSFCATGCVSDDDCKTGFACAGGFCAPLGGTCECQPLHIELGAATTCFAVSELGSCPGSRRCEVDGLSACSAPAPAEELCDGIDNDCDALTDEFAPQACETANEFGSCIGTRTCDGTAFVCDAAVPTAEVCDGVDQNCNGVADEDFPDTNGDGTADCVESDFDNDGILNDDDNCPFEANPDQTDTDSDGDGDACDTDDDDDNTPDVDDCGPTDATVYPLAPEVCDGLDNDCDTVIDEATCSDENPCTEDVCEPATGCVNPPNTDACSDGNTCTSNDVCVGGGCVGKFTNCDDANPCTDDTCDSVVGCLNTLNTSPCEDGSTCTLGDKCSGGVCLPGSPPSCPDGNTCLKWACDELAGCAPEFLDGNCSDGNLCTASDVCSGAACSGSLIACDDDDPCTDDSCDPALGCVVVAGSGAPCDDGLECTEADACVAGSCEGTDVGCDCEADADCALFEDGDLCNGTLFCDKAAEPFKCRVKTDTVVTCAEDGSLSSDCVTVACNPDTAGCETTLHPTASACDDGDLCSTDDQCGSGQCSGIPAVCDDGNVCTSGSCDPSVGCSFQANIGVTSCDDGNACTSSDQCADGFCVGETAVVCTDNNPCTADSCDVGSGCVFTNTTQPCDDENSCTLSDGCLDGACSGSAISCDDGNTCNGAEDCAPSTGCIGGVPLVCDDGLLCTTDECSTIDGCISTPNHDACDDKNVCTGNETCDLEDGCVSAGADAGVECDDEDHCTVSDSCDGIGACEGSTADCDDGNVCTTDSCDPESGCVYETAAGVVDCDDGNACTTVDACSNGFCLGSTSLDCDDSNPCTSDTCDGVEGCDNVPNTLPCDDGKACTSADSCQGGNCQGTDLDCDDGNACNGLESCDDAGGCLSGVEPNCSDGIDCTVDTCSPAEGCKHFANDGDCDDGVFCNGLETCGAAGCSGDALADGTACPDDDACTDNEQCEDGACVASTTDCDDQNPCTEDACAESGCVSTAVAGACDDGNPCTLEDTCNEGLCDPGSAVVCDDVNPCTDDTCDSETGDCAFEDNVAVCDDGDACSESDTCAGGTCLGTPLSCDHLNTTCTEGLCQNGTCVETPLSCGVATIRWSTPTAVVKTNTARILIGQGQPTGPMPSTGLSVRLGFR